nr:hypothetical protein Hi04_10k_c4039_00032 [uncultured bacterium]
MFCDVLDKHLPVQFYCVVVLDDFNAPKWMHNSYFIAFWMLLSIFVQNQKRVGFSEPIDFVFDDQVVEKKKVIDTWGHFLQAAPPEVRPLIGIEPVFLDDKQFKPLQAADLMAWHTREWNEGVITGDLKKTFNTPIPLFQGEFSGLGVRLDEKKLRETFKNIIRAT